MTILAETAGWNSTITNVLLVVHVAVCLLLCLVVLMQRPKQEGLGAAFGGGMTDQAFGARTTDVLQKGTVYLASILFIITLVLSILVSTKSNDASISKDIEEKKETAVTENGDAAAKAAADLDKTDLDEKMEEATGDSGEEEAGTDATTPVVPIPEVPAPVIPPTDSSDSGQ